MADYNLYEPQNEEEAQRANSKEALYIKSKIEFLVNNPLPSKKFYYICFGLMAIAFVLGVVSFVLTSIESLSVLFMILGFVFIAVGVVLLVIGTVKAFKRTHRSNYLMDLKQKYCRILQGKKTR